MCLDGRMVGRGIGQHFASACAREYLEKTRESGPTCRLSDPKAAVASQEDPVFVRRMHDYSALLSSLWSTYCSPFTPQYYAVHPSTHSDYMPAAKG